MAMRMAYQKWKSGWAWPERAKLHRQPMICSLRFLPPSWHSLLMTKKTKWRLAWGLGVASVYSRPKDPEPPAARTKTFIWEDTCGAQTQHIWHQHQSPRRPGGHLGNQVKNKVMKGNRELRPGHQSFWSSLGTQDTNNPLVPSVVMLVLSLTSRLLFPTPNDQSGEGQTILRNLSLPNGGIWFTEPSFCFSPLWYLLLISK